MDPPGCGDRRDRGVCGGAAACLRRADFFHSKRVHGADPPISCDHIVVDKLSYDLHGVDRGDIVVFARPSDEHCAGPPVSDLVKRVIGLPGETISLNGRGYVEINGKRLDESWLPASVQGTTYPGPPGTPFNLAHPYRVPANQYFVMGDDRGGFVPRQSLLGPVSGSEIVGKVDLRIWPLSALTLF